MVPGSPSATKDEPDAVQYGGLEGQLLLGRIADRQMQRELPQRGRQRRRCKGPFQRPALRLCQLHDNLPKHTRG